MLERGLFDCVNEYVRIEAALISLYRVMMSGGVGIVIEKKMLRGTVRETTVETPLSSSIRRGCSAVLQGSVL